MLMKRRAARRALRTLSAEAKGPDDIAQRLQEMEITGIRGGNTGCPIAAYLRRSTGVPVRVLGETYVINSPFLPGIDYFTRTPLPPVIQAFISRFDNGDYPYLYPEPGV